MTTKLNLYMPCEKIVDVGEQLLRERGVSNISAHVNFFRRFILSYVKFDEYFSDNSRKQRLCTPVRLT